MTRSLAQADKHCTCTQVWNSWLLHTHIGTLRRHSHVNVLQTSPTERGRFGATLVQPLKEAARTMAETPNTHGSRLKAADSAQRIQACQRVLKILWQLRAACHILQHDRHLHALLMSACAIVHSCSLVAYSVTTQRELVRGRHHAYHSHQVSCKLVNSQAGGATSHHASQRQAKS
jgi:hypothetical protein